jgi:hypothetical protein
MERLVAPTEAVKIAELTSPVLITEAEVAFGTALAVPLRPTTPGWLTRASHFALTVHRALAVSMADERRPPRHHPKRLRYLEGARMEREMDRL